MPDPYQSPDAQADAAVTAMKDRLEARGRDSRFNGFIDAYLRGIEVGEGGTLVDLGCGTGVVTRRVATRMSEDVRVCGVDISRKFIEEAKALSEGLSIEWIVNEGKLPFEAKSVDVFVMHTLLCHVPDVVGLLREVCGCLKDKGMIVVFDADYASTTYALPDYEKAREIDYKLLSSIVTQMDLCRQLPRYAKEAGLWIESHRADVISEAGKGDYWLSSVHSWQKLIPALHLLPEDEAAEWVGSMLKSQEEGTFFAASNYYTFVLRKAA